MSKIENQRGIRSIKSRFALLKNNQNKTFVFILLRIVTHGRYRLKSLLG